MCNDFNQGVAFKFRIFTINLVLLITFPQIMGEVTT